MSCGKISTCAEMNCNFKCCDFDQGNYILLFPGELDEAIQNNQSILHLKILEKDEMNGHKVICTATQKHNCDNGYKPLDCRFYPLFPKEITSDKIIVQKGLKCPLDSINIENHVSFVFNETKRISAKNHLIFDWLNNATMVGYFTQELNVTNYEKNSYNR